MDNHSIITMKKFEEAKKYWLNKLAGNLTEWTLPGDFPKAKSYSPDVYRLAMGENQAK
jgi:fengycin family lipopeptide synthetase D